MCMEDFGDFDKPLGCGSGARCNGGPDSLAGVGSRETGKRIVVSMYISLSRAIEWKGISGQGIFF